MTETITTKHASRISDSINTALYNDYQVNISRRIQNQDTFFFESELEARAVARKMRSYHYQVFNHKKQHAGFAVPK